MNEKNDNFLKSKVFQGAGVIQLRTVVSGRGLFRFTMKGLEGDTDLVQSISRCDALLLGITIHPVMTQNFALRDPCPEATSLPRTLDFSSQQ